MAALDRLDDLETFLLSLHADDVFRPRRMWQLPLGGLRDYTLPATIATRLGQPDELGARLAGSEIELVVFATDVSDHVDADGTRSYELAYSSHTDSPNVMGRAILASAAVSALVLPIPIDDVIATDGGWVRNFPLEYAEANPGVGALAAFRYIASYRPLDVSFLERLRERLERFRAVPPVRGDPRRDQAGRGARAPWRAGALSRADHPAHARRDRPQHRARGAVLERPGSGRRPSSTASVTRSSSRLSRPPRHGASTRFARSSRGCSRRPGSRSARIARSTGSSSGPHRARAASIPPTEGEWDEATKLGLIERGYRITDEALADRPGFLE